VHATGTATRKCAMCAHCRHHAPPSGLRVGACAAERTHGLLLVNQLPRLRRPTERLNVPRRWRESLLWMCHEQAVLSKAVHAMPLALSSTEGRVLPPPRTSTASSTCQHGARRHGARRRARYIHPPMASTIRVTPPPKAPPPPSVRLPVPRHCAAGRWRANARHFYPRQRHPL